ncbi:universal stress protein [Pedobacter aquae]|uniref:Universal stress protein n=1 Tax=Pedobacter aquae TaxID=2605747 RepID=A0A5C0VET4_9SPHI|nr:universal stress protein [Pedobacter aquae]QEK50587.1 universal stress protein [Pedobacter aquae]
MIKILVTTDFSANSKAAIRFAIKFATQYPEVSLTFFHSYHILKPTSYSDAKFEAYEKAQKENISKRLEKFVKDVYHAAGIKPSEINCVCRESVVAHSNIMNYAEHEGFNFIAIGTRGAGKIEKLFGTHTSYVISQSSIPVIAVPKTYRSRDIESVLYASDLINLDKELDQVIDFAKPIDAKIEVVHFGFPSDIAKKVKLAEEKVKNHSDYPVEFHVQPSDFIKSLVDNIETAVKRSKPSMLVMFTDQKVSFFKKMLFSGNTEEFALNTRVPLLVYPK